MIEFILAVITGFLVRSVADECGIGFKSMARWIVKRSVHLLAEERERYEEQWLADLEDRKTAIRQMLFALGVVMAARVLRRDSPQTLDAIKPATRLLARLGGLQLAEKDLQLLNDMLADLPNGTEPESIEVLSCTGRKVLDVIRVDELVIYYRVSGAARIDRLSNWLRQNSRHK